MHSCEIEKLTIFKEKNNKLNPRILYWQMFPVAQSSGGGIFFCFDKPFLGKTKIMNRKSQHSVSQTTWKNLKSIEPFTKANLNIIFPKEKALQDNDKYLNQHWQYFCNS